MLCAVFGAVLMLVSGGVLVATELAIVRITRALPQGNLFGGDDPEPGADIEGPLNILLAGLDTRPSRPNEPARADSIMILHVPAGLDRGYLISLPRDARVAIPPFPETGFPGAFEERLNSAMFFGSQQLPGEERPDLERGFRLLARTASQLTGVTAFDAGAVIKFEGFVGVVDAMGGITVDLEEEIYSRHRQPDGTHRPLGCGSFCGPQAYYPPGVNRLEGWQALDIARQRYGVTDGEFGRQRNQQLILKAMLEQALSREMLTNVPAANRVLSAAGDALVLDTRGREPIEFGFALRGLRPAALHTVTLPTVPIGVGDGYQGEEVQPEAYELFEALRAGQLDQFLAERPDYPETPEPTEPPASP